MPPRLALTDRVQINAAYVHSATDANHPLTLGGPFGVIIQVVSSPEPFLVAVVCVGTDGEMCERRWWYSEQQIERLSDSDNASAEAVEYALHKMIVKQRKH